MPKPWQQEWSRARQVQAWKAHEASGKSSGLATLRNAATGSRVIVTGIVDQGPRTFLVGSVTVVPASGGR